ncbi:MAG: leucine-rich repeat domain-containing protein [Acidimicrobiaceae bacterium]|nr:leucine-rich repeat domain-containing protein [Acidimicrobiaceae bacterium]
MSEWSQSAAVAAPQRAEAEPAFDPFTAPTRSGIDLERLREAAATITPGDADCAAVPALDVEGVTVVDPPAGLDDPDAELTVAEVARVSGGCLIVEYVALAGRTVAQVRDLLATDASVHAVGEPARGLALADNTGAHTHTGGHHNDSGRTDGEQWHLPQPTMQALWDGWNDDPDRQVVVAVLDTGVDTTHPDLDDNVAADSPGGCHTTDNNGHGTQMAGIIAAKLGGGHVAGVAPKAKILPLRMARLSLDPEDTDCSDPDMRLAPMTAPAAIAEAVNRGARVINMSFTGTARRDSPDIVAGGVGIPSKDTYELVLRAAAMLGVVAVTSAGNCGAADGKDLTAKQKEDCSEQDAAERPALYDDVIAVASINSAGARVDSSTANEHVDVAAPGDDILTTRASCTGTHCVQESGKTSAAAAFVSGVVAHLLNRYPQASVGQVRRALEQSALRPPLPPRHPEDIGPFRPENPAIRLKWTPRGRDGDDAVMLEPHQQAPTAEYGRGIVDPAAAVTRLGALVGALEPVGAAGAFRALSAGGRHSCGLRASGAVVCWGLDAVVDETPDVAFASLSSPAGGDFVCGVRLVDSAVVCWGDVPDEITSDVAGARVLDPQGATAPEGRFEMVAVGDRHVCGVRPDGRVVCWGDDSSGQTDAPVAGFGQSSGGYVTAIAAGGEHTCALELVRELTVQACWGEDQGGRLPPSGSLVGARQIAAGAVNTCVIGSDDTLHCFGSNSRGVLDAPAGSFTALDAGSHHMCAISAGRGRGLRCWGDSTNGRLAAPAGQYLQVAAGGRHSCALSVYARVVCWGDNSDGQAPQQARLNSLSLTAGGTDLLAGRFHPDITDYTVITSESRASLRASVSTGDETRSRICAGSGRRRTCEAVSRTAPTGLTDGDTITVTVRALFGFGESRTYRIRVVAERPRLVSLNLSTAGSGCTGACVPLFLNPRFASEYTNYRVVVSDDVAEATVDFTAVGGSAVVSPEDADAAVFGHQLSLRVGGFASVDAGWTHSCGLRTGGTIMCWGDNDNGETDAPAGALTAVTSGGYHSCGLSAQGAWSCWGWNLGGQTDIPAGSFSAVDAGVVHTCGVKTDGTAQCWGWNYFGQSDAPGGVFSAVAAGSAHSCGLRLGGSVECWGSSASGRTGAPSGSFRSISAGWGHTCGIKTDGTAQCWGDNVHGQSDAPSGQFGSVSAGWHHSCGLRPGGTVVCWGSDDDGQSGAPAGRFSAVTAGRTHSCGLRPDGTVQCWGAVSRLLVAPGPFTADVTVTSAINPALSITYRVTIERQARQDSSSRHGFATSAEVRSDDLFVRAGLQPATSAGDNPPRGASAGGGASEADSTRAGAQTTPSEAGANPPACPAASGGQPSTTAVTILDGTLRAAIERELGKAPGAEITGADMAQITSLSLAEAQTRQRVSDLSGLEHAVNMTTLDLYSQSVTQLSPLSCLGNLRALGLARNQITGLGPLRGLSSLERLHLYDNQITDLAPLANLSRLTALYLDHNDITDVSALSGLTSLAVLGLGDNSIADVAPLAGLTGLEVLYVFDNDIVDASALAALGGLGVLWIDGNDIAGPYRVPRLGALGYLDARHNLVSDVAPLDAAAAPEATVHREPQRVATIHISDPGLRSVLLAATGRAPGEALDADEVAAIERLDITAVELGDLSELRALKSLRRLNLHHNSLTGLDGLPALEGLDTLFVDFNNITDLAPLTALRGLSSLGLVGNNIADLEPLAALTGLESLYLSANNIADLTDLAGLRRLHHLRLTTNNIADLEPLKELTALTQLHLRHNNIADLEPLAGLTGLTHLDLRDNNITSLEPLTGLTKLQDLHIGGNHITDYSPLDHLTALTIHGRDHQASTN